MTLYRNINCTFVNAYYECTKKKKFLWMFPACIEIDQTAKCLVASRSKRPKGIPPPPPKPPPARRIKEGVRVENDRS